MKISRLLVKSEKYDDQKLSDKPEYLKCRVFLLFSVAIRSIQSGRAVIVSSETLFSKSGIVTSARRINMYM